MKVFGSTLAAQKYLARGSSVTIGNFDGVHLGHRALIEDAVDVASARRLKSVVLSFEPHPVKILAPAAAPLLINTAAQKTELLGKLGLDALVLQRFDKKFAALSPQSFVRRCLHQHLSARHVFVGYDFTFGRKREGHVEMLMDWGRQLDIAVHIVPARLLGGTLISSTTIRRLVAAGEVAKAATLLARPFFIDGTVVHGENRGGELGIHTANLATANELLPADGVYATWVHFAGRLFKSVTNIGFNPTFGNEKRSCETHIFHFDRKIYGKKLRLLFVERIREERKFPSQQALVDQIRKDIIKARDILGKE